MTKALGIIGTGLVMGSFLLDGDLMRAVNVIACMTWVVYGTMKQDRAVITVNTAIAVINISHLVA